MPDENNHLEVLVFFHRLAALVGFAFCAISLFGLQSSSEMLAHQAGAQELHMKGQLSFFSWAPIFTTVFGFLLSLTFTLSYVGAAECLRRRCGFHFCFVLSFFSCIFIPVGTMLGIYTIRTLTQNEVRRLFGQE